MWTIFSLQLMMQTTTVALQRLDAKRCYSGTNKTADMSDMMIKLDIVDETLFDFTNPNDLNLNSLERQEFWCIKIYGTNSHVISEFTRPFLSLEYYDWHRRSLLCLENFIHLPTTAERNSSIKSFFMYSFPARIYSFRERLRIFPYI